MQYRGRDTNFRLRLTEKEREYIKQQAELRHKTATEYIMDLFEHNEKAPLIRYPQEVVAKAIREATGIFEGSLKKHLCIRRARESLLVVLEPKPDWGIDIKKIDRNNERLYVYYNGTQIATIEVDNVDKELKVHFVDRREVK